MNRTLFGWSARRWLMFEALTFGMVVTADWPWWLLVPAMIAHGVMVVAYGDACAVEARIKEAT